MSESFKLNHSFKFLIWNCKIKRKPHIKVFSKIVLIGSFILLKKTLHVWVMLTFLSYIIYYVILIINHTNYGNEKYFFFSMYYKPTVGDV